VNSQRLHNMRGFSFPRHGRVFIKSQQDTLLEEIYHFTHLDISLKLTFSRGVWEKSCPHLYHMQNNLTLDDEHVLFEAKWLLPVSDEAAILKDQQLPD
jgi:hypothetical protein